MDLGVLVGVALVVVEVLVHHLIQIEAGQVLHNLTELPHLHLEVLEVPQEMVDGIQQQLKDHPLVVNLFLILKNTLGVMEFQEKLKG